MSRLMLKNSQNGPFFEKKGSGNPEKIIENLREAFFPNLEVSMCANFHQDRSSGLACASDTHIQTNIQAKIGIKPTFLKKFFGSSWGYGGSWGGSLWVAVIDNLK